MKKRNKKKGFTLVELLAVIVILAIILVIAVPKVMSIIEDAKMGTLESTAKMIASGAEKQKVQNTVLGNNKEITCDSVAKINEEDYANCSITFVDNTALVTIEGSGKFNGLWVCDGTKTSAEATEEGCTPAFENDDWATIIEKVNSGNHPYKVGNEKEIDLGDLGVHTVRIANLTPCEGLDLSSQTACVFVIEFTDIITTLMHNDDPGNGGLNYWDTSLIRTYINETIFDALPEVLKNNIIDTNVVFGTTGVSETTDKLYLLSSREIWDASHIAMPDASFDATRQLDYYASKNVSYENGDEAIKEYGEEGAVDWWLRSNFPWHYYPDFFYVTTSGIESSTRCNNVYGVSPAFRLAN